MRRIIYWCFCLLLSCSLAFGQDLAAEKTQTASPAKPPTPEELLKELLLFAGGTEQSGADEQSDARSSFTALSQVRSAMSDHHWRNASQVAESSARNMQSGKYRRLWDAFAESLRQASIADIESTLPQCKELINSLHKQLAEAKTSAQTANISANIRKSQSRLQAVQMQGTFTEEFREANEQLNNASTFVKRYAQFLVACESSEDRGRGQIAQELLRHNQYDSRWRSAIRPHIESSFEQSNKVIEERLKAIAKRVEEAKSVEDIAKATTELQTLASYKSDILDFPRGEDAMPIHLSQLAQWREVLSLESDGRYKGASRRLESFNAMNRNVALTNPLITRAMLQAKSMALSEAIDKRGDGIFDPAIRRLVEQFDNAKDIADLRVVTKRMQTQDPRDRSSDLAEDSGVLDELMAALNEGTNLVNMDENIEQRNWDRFWSAVQARNTFPGKPAHRWSSRFETIRLGMLRRVLSDSKEFKELNLSEKSPIDVDLLSNVDSAIAAKDYRKAYLLLQLYQRVIYPTTSPQWLLNELVAFQFLVQAESFDLSGDTLEAGRRYRTVMLYPSSRIPIEPVQERLKDILSKHPELAHENINAGPIPTRILPKPNANPFEPNK